MELWLDNLQNSLKVECTHLQNSLQVECTHYGKFVNNSNNIG